MSVLGKILDDPLMYRMGWVLLHSIWQGVLVGGLFALVRFGSRRCSANFRYLLGGLGLILMLVLPVVTFVIIAPPVSQTNEQISHNDMFPAAIESAFGGQTFGARIATSPDSFFQTSVAVISELAPWLAAVWLAGVAFFALKLIRSWWCVEKIRTKNHDQMESVWVERLNELRRRLGISQPVRLLKSVWVEVPTVIGWLRPVILVPAASLAGLTRGQLEAILAHELAHVRRFDYLVNVFQCLVEILMFYHPVVWWISHSVREERENCCDDLVVKVCGDRIEYARALATLEEFRVEPESFAFVASGGSLVNRVRRLLGMADKDGPAGARQVGGLAFLGVGLVLIGMGIYLNLSPTRYSAEARINLEFGQTDSEKSDSQKEISTNHDEDFISYKIENIQSKSVLSNVVEALNLDREWGTKYGKSGKLKMDDAISLLKRQIKIFPIGNTAIIEIRAFSDSPDEAARIANAVAEAYKQSRLEESREQNLSEIKSLREQFNEQESKVRKAQEEADRLRKEYAGANANQPPPSIEDGKVQQLEVLHIQNQAAYERQKKLLGQLKSLSPEDLRRVLPTAMEPPDALLTSLLDQLNQARQKVSDLAKDNQPDDSTYQNARQKVNDLDGKVNKRVNDLMVDLKDRVAAIRAFADSLTNQIAQAREIDNKRIANAQAYSDVKDRLERLLRFQTVLDMKIAAETTDLNLPHSSAVQVVDRAVPPPHPVSPNRFLAVTMLLLGILFSATGSVMMRGSRSTGTATHLV